MATGYEDIDRLTNQQNSMLDESLKQQQDIVNKQTQMNVDALERNKAEIDQQTTKTNQGLYTEYKKATNPYGVNAEQLYAKGLGNSGYAETTQTNLYNTYQKNVTNTINNAQKLKADVDFKINQAMQNGDLTIAKNALEIYKNKMQLLTQEYELRNNREQYLYQKEQNALAQSNWEKEYAYQQERDRIADQQYQQSFDYQKQRDAIADQQWARQYALSSRKASSSSSGNTISTEDTTNETTQVNDNPNIQKLYNNLSKAQPKDNISKNIYRNLIYGEVQNGNITEADASALFEEFNL